MKHYNSNSNLSGLWGMPPAFICNTKDAMSTSKMRIGQIKNHAKKRAYERYSISLNSTDLHEMARQIRYGESILIKRTKRKYSYRCYIRYKNNVYKVIYDKNLGMIRTFLG